MQTASTRQLTHVGRVRPWLLTHLLFGESVGSGQNLRPYLQSLCHTITDAEVIVPSRGTNRFGGHPVESDRVAPLSCEMKPLEPLSLAWKGELAVRVHPADVEVFLDDAPLPPSGAVPVGSHRLRVVRSGCAMDAGRRARSAPTDPARLEPTTDPCIRRRAARTRRSSTQLVVRFLGVGGVLAGVAGYLLLGARSDWRRWNNGQDALDARWAETGADRTGLVDDQRENDALARSIQSETQMAIALGAIGVGALAEGVYLYLTADPASEP
jgi:hypothetical protein